MIQSLATVLALLSLFQAWISPRGRPPTVVFVRQRQYQLTKPFTTLVRWWHIALVMPLLAIRTSELQLWLFAQNEMSNLDLRTRAGILLALILWNWCLGTLLFALDGFVLKRILESLRDAGTDIPAPRPEILLALALVNWCLGQALAFALDGFGLKPI